MGAILRGAIRGFTLTNQECNLEFSKAGVQPMKRAHQNFVKADAVCEYCFSNPLVKDILWEELLISLL